MKQEIHFVTGKGGVGKSAVAASLALKKSSEGQRVLLVELGDTSFYRDYFDLAEVTFKPTLIKPNLSIALWTGQECLQEYAKHLIKIETIVKLFFENPVMKAFINIAPGLPELAILGKVTSGLRKHGPSLPYDCIIVDTFATGHFMALLEAPKGMAEAIQYGPMGEQSRNINTCLRDSNVCFYHVVCLPEELVIQESLELVQFLKNKFEISAELIINKVLDVNLSEETLNQSKVGESDLARFASYLLRQTQHQRLMLEKAKTFAPKFVKVPLFFESRPWDLLSKIAGALP